MRRKGISERLMLHQEPKAYLNQSYLVHEATGHFLCFAVLQVLLVNPCMMLHGTWSEFELLFDRCLSHNAKKFLSNFIVQCCCKEDLESWILRKKIVVLQSHRPQLMSELTHQTHSVKTVTNLYYSYCYC